MEFGLDWFGMSLRFRTVLCAVTGCGFVRRVFGVSSAVDLRYDSYSSP
jgi:hypothetical protein